jgi:hypothetical protein
LQGCGTTCFACHTPRGTFYGRPTNGPPKARATGHHGRRRRTRRLWVRGEVMAPTGNTDVPEGLLAPGAFARWLVHAEGYLTPLVRAHGFTVFVFLWTAGRNHPSGPQQSSLDRFSVFGADGASVAWNHVVSGHTQLVQAPHRDRFFHGLAHLVGCIEELPTPPQTEFQLVLSAKNTAQPVQATAWTKHFGPGLHGRKRMAADHQGLKRLYEGAATPKG